MANYHILQQAIDKKTINVVYHIPIPAAGTNQAGLSWRDAIVLDQGGAVNITSNLPGISTAELDAMKTGALIERQENLRFSILGLTPAEKKLEIEARFNVLRDGTSESILQQKQITLEWLGYENNVP